MLALRSQRRVILCAEDEALQVGEVDDFGGAGGFTHPARGVDVGGDECRPDGRAVQTPCFRLD